MSEGLRDTKQAAEYLNVSYDWLKRQVAGRKVPHTRLGKFVRFSPDHLAEIIKQGEQGLVTSKPMRSSARSKL